MLRWDHANSTASPGLIQATAAAHLPLIQILAQSTSLTAATGIPGLNPDTRTAQLEIRSTGFTQSPPGTGYRAVLLEADPDRANSATVEWLTIVHDDIGLEIRAEAQGVASPAIRDCVFSTENTSTTTPTARAHVLLGTDGIISPLISGCALKVEAGAFIASGIRYGWSTISPYRDFYPTVSNTIITGEGGANQGYGIGFGIHFDTFATPGFSPIVTGCQIRRCGSEGIFYDLKGQVRGSPTVTATISSECGDQGIDCTGSPLSGSGNGMKVFATDGVPSSLVLTVTDCNFANNQCDGFQVFCYGGSDPAIASPKFAGRFERCKASGNGDDGFSLSVAGSDAQPLPELTTALDRNEAWGNVRAGLRLAVSGGSASVTGGPLLGTTHTNGLYHQNKWGVVMYRDPLGLGPVRIESKLVELTIAHNVEKGIHYPQTGSFGAGPKLDLSIVNYNPPSAPYVDIDANFPGINISRSNFKSGPPLPWGPDNTAIDPIFVAFPPATPNYHLAALQQNGCAVLDTPHTLAVLILSLPFDFDGDARPIDHPSVSGCMGQPEVLDKGADEAKP